MAEPLDFLSGESGTLGLRALLLGRVRDLLADAATAPTRLAVRDAARLHPPARRVLVLGVERPAHAVTAAAAKAELAHSRHDVSLRLTPGAEGLGKWENLNALLAEESLDGVEWLVLLDDDVVLPRRFLDVFLFCAERHDLVLVQPAHRFDSHAAWRQTRRRPAIARRTRFVEIGPVTALRSTTFDTLLPFPPLRMGWGLDAHWASVARERGWPVGIVDAVPVRHTRPVAGAYPREEAIAEARHFLSEHPYLPASEARTTIAVHRDWR